MKDVFCVIMAGGAGTRFWPISTQTYPKQFLDIMGTGRSFLQMTFDRYKSICEIDNYIIVTHAAYKELVLEQLPELSENQVLTEPFRKNTAPCIAYANYRIESQNPNARIIVAPADHLIINEDLFIKDIITGLDFCKKNDALLTIGIRPNRPETAYGYIQIDSKKQDSELKIGKVKTFTEKPNADMAKVFLQSGDFLWNSGIFIWSLKSINKAFKQYLEDVDLLFNEYKSCFGTKEENKAILKIYSEVKNISIDYGIMEKSSNVYVKCADFLWSDLGTWNSLYDNLQKDNNNNVIRGSDVLAYNTENTIIEMPDDKIVLVNGLNGFVVAERDNKLLICPKEKEKELREMVNNIKIRKGDNLA